MWTPNAVQAAITVTGNTNPTYAGTDPWEIGGNLSIGALVSGTLQIDNASVVNDSSGYLGFDSDWSGTATITGAGSAWNNTDDLVVGESGTGILNIANAGVVNSAVGILGNNTGSNGTATVTGAGSIWYNGQLNVGHKGNGTLNIENSGVVNVTRDTWVNVINTGTGTINFNNGTLNTGGLLASPDQLHGSGMVSTSGLVSDIDLVFDNSTGPQQLIIFNSQPGQNITLNLDASSAVAAGSLGAGYRGTGTLAITDGIAVHSRGGLLGNNPGAIGTADISGVGSTWENSGSLMIGYTGSGALNIENGGVVSNTDGSISYLYGSSGAVTVSGVGSQWNNNGNLTVGRHGSTTMDILNGGVVNSTTAFIGRTAPWWSTATIAGEGSAWNNSDLLTVGQGSLSIESGGVVNSLNGRIGHFGGANATVSGAGSTWNIEDSLHVGYNAGQGKLDISPGGLVIVTNDLSMGTYTGGSGGGTINLQGGTLQMHGGSLTKGVGYAHFNFTGGTFTGASLINIDQPFVQHGGTLAPGGSIGQTDILSDYNLTGGTVEIELGGIGNPIDLVTATGDIDIAILGTTLDLRAIGSMAAGTYTILESTGGTIAGMFENVSLFNLFGVNVTVLNTGTTITVTLDNDLIFADPNSDGFVGIADLNIVLGNWNQIVTAGDILAGDLNGDGYVGIEDLNAILGNWNAGTPPMDVTAAIPEPGTVGMLALGAVCCFRSRAVFRR